MHHAWNGQDQVGGRSHPASTRIEALTILGGRRRSRQSMIPKSGHRFSEKIMLQE
jgi:hypothetical protein